MTRRNLFRLIVAAVMGRSVPKPSKSSPLYKLPSLVYKRDTLAALQKKFVFDYTAKIPVREGNTVTWRRA